MAARFWLQPTLDLHPARTAGTRHFTAHRFKDRFVSLLAHAGLPLPLVSEIAGHSKRTTTLNVYNHTPFDEPPERTRALHGRGRPLPARF
ncbi:MAG: tyrosine-type recombinase/integrase [Thermoleophilia bacterium]|nr:tyrosine-type recombinase/integrase [Thermoleophilia bacterium]